MNGYGELGEWKKCKHEVTLNKHCIFCGDRAESKLRLFTNTSTSRLVSMEDLRENKEFMTEDKEFMIFALKMGYIVEDGKNEIVLDIKTIPATNIGSLKLENMVNTGHTLLNTQHQMELENSGIRINWNYNENTIEVYQGPDTYTVEYIKYGEDGKIIDYDTLKKVREPHIRHL